MQAVKCNHQECEWPGPDGLCELARFDAGHPEPTLLQWCCYCGSYREIHGQLIGFWVRPQPRGYPVSMIDAAVSARKLLHRLTGRIEIDEALRSEIDASERALWDALFPGAASTNPTGTP